MCAGFQCSPGIEFSIIGNEAALENGEQKLLDDENVDEKQMIFHRMSASVLAVSCTYLKYR